MSGSIVVLGATGYAGGLAVEALVRRGVRPVLAGTREAALREISERHGGLEWRIADATDVDSVRSLVDAGDVLVTTVGPFNRLGRVVARAAAAQGAHYVDSTGEVGFVQHLLDTLDAPARTTGSVMLPAFGYDYVPGLLAGALALRDAGGAAYRLDVDYCVRGTLDNGRGLSQGTRRTMTEEMGNAVLVRRAGHLTGERMASRVQRFPVDGSQQPGILAGGTEVLFLPRHWPGLQEVRVFNGWFPSLARAMQVASAITGVLTRVPGGQDLLRKVTARGAGPAGGPDAAQRARAQGGAVAVVRSATGEVLSSVQLTGPNPYDVTAELMAWAAQQLAEGRAQQAGVVDALDAFGLDVLEQAAAGMGLVRA